MPDRNEWMKLHEQMPDGGPIYTETNPLETIMEPWNAVSSIVVHCLRSEVLEVHCFTPFASIHFYW